MKNLFILLFTTLTTFVSAQVPDTIFIEPINKGASIVLGLVGSSGVSEAIEPLYVIYEGKTLPNTNLVVNTPVDKKFTEQELINYLTNLIYRNENLNWLDEARLMERKKLETIYPIVNGILSGLEVEGFHKQMLSKFSSSFVGTWKLTSSGVESYLKILDTGIVLVCDEFGEPISGETPGSILVKTENRFVLTGLEGLTTTTFNKSINKSDFSDNTMTKVLSKVD